MPLIISSACGEVSPAGSGVPVPGAKAGSMPSISKVKYVGVLSPINALTSAINGVKDFNQHSSA